MTELDPFENTSGEAGVAEERESIAVSEESAESETQALGNVAYESEVTFCLPQPQCQQTCGQSDPITAVLQSVFSLMQ